MEIMETTIAEFRYQLNYLNELYDNIYSNDVLQDLLQDYENLVADIYDTIDTIEDTDEYTISRLEEIVDDVQVKISYIQLQLE
jgi:DNA-binding ferritin-like protein